jgi:hypothetical protein
MNKYFMNKYDIDFLSLRPDALENEARRDFEGLALQIFNYQAQNNPIYRLFLQHLRIDAEKIDNIYHIPCLPINLFKFHELKTADWQPQRVFKSSGTTQSQRSQHLLRQADFYQQLAQIGIESQYQLPLHDVCTLALLPSYLAQGDSSLVFMVDDFIRKSNQPDSGFCLDNMPQLAQILQKNAQHNIPTLLFGVSYALQDFAELFAMPLAPNIRIIETGGMKGRRKEISKQALHAQLQNAFPNAHIDSEYGMTELLSQAYMRNGRTFCPNSTLRIWLRDPTDPFARISRANKTGAINAIDLANINTISFIATDDLGRMPAPDDSPDFEVLGRFDAADIRGCNLLIN